jgi:hypothetical protein
MTALTKASRNCKRQTYPLVRENVNMRTIIARVQLKKKMLVVSLKGLVVKTN